MTPQEIKLGTRLEFEMLNKQDEKVGNTFISQLLEHQDDGSIVISAPITESRVVFVPAGITVRSHCASAARIDWPQSPGQIEGVQGNVAY
jgi:hypothetical protein